MVGKLDGVAHQVEHDLPDTLLVGLDRVWDVWADGAAQGDTADVGGKFEDLSNLANEFSQVDLASV